MAKNQVENIVVDGWKVEVTYIPSHGKYVAEALDDDGNKFDSVASRDRQQTINTAVALANAGEYYRPFGGESSRSSNTTNEFFRDYESETKQKPRQGVEYHKGMKRERMVELRAGAILAVVGIGAAISFLLLIFSL